MISKRKFTYSWLAIILLGLVVSANGGDKIIILYIALLWLCAVAALITKKTKSQNKRIQQQSQSFLIAFFIFTSAHIIVSIWQSTYQEAQLGGTLRFRANDSPFISKKFEIATD